MRKPFFSILADQKGQGLTEYVILVVLVSLVSIVAVRSMGKEIKAKLQKVRQQLNEEVTFAS